MYDQYFNYILPEQLAVLLYCKKNNKIKQVKNAAVSFFMA